MYDRTDTTHSNGAAPTRVGKAGRTAALVLAALLAAALFVGYREHLPRWAFGMGDSAATLLGPPLPPMDAAVVAATVEPQLVNIEVALRPSGTSAAGTGIVLTADGQVLTSHHVVKGADAITVGDLGNGRDYPATVLGYDATADIALLSLSGASGLPVARVGSSAALRLGDEILAIGNAGGTGSPTVTPGWVTSLNSSIQARDAADLSRKSLTGMIEVAAPVASGQSGGALVDRYGAVVGVVTASSGEAAKAAGRASGYAVPIDRALTVIRQIRSGTPTDTVHVGPTATLGVLTSDARQPPGARIDIALYGQPAYRAGLLTGEVITAVDGRPITSVQGLKAALNVRKPEEAVRLDLVGPDGSHRTLSVVLAVGPPN
ncbi:S1C family serine protease [Nocardia sp. CDC159]|uniref:S1C family serine protease n=1 Tax=Nocardia pulmonis TaxID=2951408 RepID=A0A9X2IZD3_9NOCA|nr:MULTISPECIES: trypsin-like peptidase domain-containing protein [Nocardia]MCM6774821.1 S1C family serine protease [Nocardia pulmonis]MCM6789752.1 S1C family serine protease [Nocardia sp. CDC159]